MPPDLLETAMATLAQFWTTEVARLATALASTGATIDAGRAALLAAEQQARHASDAVRTQEARLRDARAALALIPLPADGDPQLMAMEQALVARSEAIAAAAAASQEALLQRARLDRLGATLAAQQAESQAAAAEKLRECGDGTPQRPGLAAARQAMVATLQAGGALATLAADAAQVLADFEAGARARVEAEFPSNADDRKHFLKRVRARRALVADSVAAADAVAAHAQAGADSALTLAQRSFDTRLAAVRRAAEAAPLLTADTATLAAQAQLPAATADTRPVLTLWQYKRLHDATRKAARETALAALADVDDAWAAWRTAQQEYDDALHTAMKANPDMTPAQLDAVPGVKTKLDARTAKAATLTTKKAAYTPLQADAQNWLACVSDNLWETLDRMDGAIDRLKGLTGPGAPAQRITDLLAAETALAAAQATAGLASRQTGAARAAQQRAAEAQAAEQETRIARLRGTSRSAALL